jgi:hypothetical protein
VGPDALRRDANVRGGSSDRRVISRSSRIAGRDLGPSVRPGAIHCAPREHRRLGFPADPHSWNLTPIGVAHLGRHDAGTDDSRNALAAQAPGSRSSAQCRGLHRLRALGGARTPAPLLATNLDRFEVKRDTTIDVAITADMRTSGVKFSSPSLPPHSMRPSSASSLRAPSRRPLERGSMLRSCRDHDRHGLRRTHRVDTLAAQGRLAGCDLAANANRHASELNAVTFDDVLRGSVLASTARAACSDCSVSRVGPAPRRRETPLRRPSGSCFTPLLLRCLRSA